MRRKSKRFLKTILVSALFVASTEALAGRDCGVVTIEQMLAGPRHGSMMRVSGDLCEWVCLDPEGQFLSSESGKRMYSFLLTQYLAKSPVRLSIQDGVYASACHGNYPVVEDVRTP